MSGVRCLQSVWSQLYKCKDGASVIRDHEKALYQSNVSVFDCC